MTYDESTKMIVFGSGPIMPFNKTGTIHFSSFEYSGYNRVTNTAVGWTQFAYWVCFIVHFICEIVIVFTNGKKYNFAKLILNIAASLVAPFLIFINAFDTTSFNYLVCTIPTIYFDLAIVAYYGYIAVGVALFFIFFVASQSDNDLKACMCCVVIVAFVIWISIGFILRISFPMVRSSTMALGISIINLIGYILEWIALIAISLRDGEFYVIVIFDQEKQKPDETEEA
jgi:hypothetical protein